MDAPYHFFPTTGTAPAKRIDEIPLEWCMAPGVVIDCTSVPPGAEIGVAELRAGLDRIRYAISPGDIAFVRTDAYRRFHDPSYPSAQPGVGRDATMWLLDQGVRVVGIDAWTWDVPLALQGDRFRREGSRDRSALWAAHRVGKDREFVCLEQLGYLDLLPRPFGFTAAVFPIKVSAASAGWVRAVAIFDDVP